MTLEMFVLGELSVAKCAFAAFVVGIDHSGMADTAYFR